MEAALPGLRHMARGRRAASQPALLIVGKTTPRKTHSETRIGDEDNYGMCYHFPHFSSA
jgi:hypothetical protein